ncbi:MAG: alpha/beta hydrolase [Candidatus Ornithospirochaeta sp.]|nr:alpha/beta hydrolase [Candidatus Ornithospirochaeta sp.]
MEERYLAMEDGHKLFYRVWPVSEPKATLHINHGMAEHSLRYERFALDMNRLGFSVYCQDHRGHGLTKEEDEKGWFAESDGSSVVCRDSWEVDKRISQDHPLIPHFIFGHSMGSFITRIVLSEHSEAFDAAVICGTGAYQGIIGKIGRRIALMHARKWGSRMPDQDMDKLAFSAYSKPFRDEESRFAWLSRDKEEVRKYEEDPFCGFVCSASFYADLIDLSNKANDRNRIANIRKNLPILFISGSMDPVGGYSKGVEKVYSLYRKAGIRDVRIKLYEGGRHEILNETNRDEVTRDIADFYSEMMRDYDGR